ncbi:S41 family peptidase [Tissierella sp.]|uniref:S41 family peptidase n=1 Tax=Tissierella sp. TaxID=41274 RepID=UPI0028659508|nr:S41 family peptidase [Tissierella sp.]MDR7857565.1 S41 family peptidase [Tissierella sp.]
MYNNKFKSIIFILILVLIAPNFAAAEDTAVESAADVEFFLEVLDYIKESYPFEIEERTLIEGALKGMLQSVDPYSNYYTPEEANSLYSGLSGTFSGVGIYIEEKDGYINVNSTMKGQPAEKAGIQKDDLIIMVNDIDIKDLGIEKVSSMIKGVTGTKVTVTVKRGEKLHRYEVTRETITISPVHSEVLEDNIGYIQLEDFSSQATKDMKKALSEFDKKGINKIILDLRDNPGGLLDQAVSIAKLFVTKGPIVHTRGSDDELFTYSSKLTKSKYKLVVLVNENSASASEILAGAIKDRKAGVLIGTKTFGKGIVQSLSPVVDGSLIKLTTSEYLTPNKTSIHGKGIEPDIQVKNTATEDLQLKKAIGELK